MNYTDQLGRNVSLAVWPPRRIVSLVPSQTELLYDLGLGEEVAGITKFCVHPAEWFRTKPRVGGTKTLNFGKIKSLQPDLIIGNKEENERNQIELLSVQYPVWMSDVTTLEDACDMMRRIGELTGKTARAAGLVQRIKDQFALHAPVSTFNGQLSTFNPLRIAYFIWRKPYLVAGSGTFIHEMLRVAGFENVFAHKTRYPETSLDELAAARPDAVFLSSEPYPFGEKHFAAFREACPEALIQLVDGEMFSWYGSRLLKAAPYFSELRKNLYPV